MCKFCDATRKWAAKWLGIANERKRKTMASAKKSHESTQPTDRSNK